jgi:hypothetical protein
MWRFPFLLEPPKTTVIRSVLSGLKAKAGPTLSFIESSLVATPGRETRLGSSPVFFWAKFAWISRRQR